MQNTCDVKEQAQAVLDTFKDKTPPQPRDPWWSEVKEEERKNISSGEDAYA